ncbi:MAG TPA: GDP-mannose 4,6-dehydratase [Stenomitos sp.]
MSWTGKRVLITGAGGFIGSHLTERLVREGATVTAFIRYNSRGREGWLSDSPPEIRQDLNVIAGDLKDGDAVRRAIRKQDVVFHLGALIAIPYSYVQPHDYVQTNIVGTANVLDACRDSEVSRLVHTSTSEVYGTARYVPIDENHPLQGQSPYSASKIGADKLVEAYHRSFDLPAVTVRPFNTYGPRQSARAVIPTVISQALVKDHVRLGSLSPTRDLTYVSDTVAGFLALASCDAAIGRTVNLGVGKEISIGDLAALILSLIDHPVALLTDDVRVRPAKSEVERLLSNNHLATELTGWSPQVSLKEGLARTVEWIKQHPEEYRVDQYSI